tara:strand:+ start:318 stop:923 length:606 start_codon:yes stop_codon:yes gene_type:complete
MSWKEKMAHLDKESILRKASKREKELIEDHTGYIVGDQIMYNQLTEDDCTYMEEREHCKRRRVMSRWAWASETAGHDDTAKAAVLMKALYAEDHNQVLRSIDKELEAHREVSADMESLLGGISKDLERIGEWLEVVAANVGNIDPSDGQTDMSGVEASLDALTSTVDLVHQTLKEIPGAIEDTTNATSHGFKSIVKEIKKF